VEIHRSQGGLVERMVGKNNWHHKKMPQECGGAAQVTDEELATTLVSIEATLNSRPIIQDTEDALTPAHFLCGAKLTTVPSTTETQREGNLKKTLQRTKRMADDFWGRWE